MHIKNVQYKNYMICKSIQCGSFNGYVSFETAPRAIDQSNPIISLSFSFIFKISQKFIYQMIMQYYVINLKPEVKMEKPLTGFAPPK